MRFSKRNVSKDVHLDDEESMVRIVFCACAGPVVSARQAAL